VCDAPDAAHIATREYLVVFAYHPCYFNMRFQELEALCSLLGVSSRAELYVDDPPPTALSDTPMVRVRLPGGDAAVRALCERAVLVKAVLDVWGEGATFPEAVKSCLALGPEVQSERHAMLAPPKTMRICNISFGRTQSLDEKREVIEHIRPLFRGDEVVDLYNSDVIIWALEEHHHVTGEGNKTHAGPRTGPPRRVFVARQAAGGRSIDKKQAGNEKAWFQKYDRRTAPCSGPRRWTINWHSSWPIALVQIAARWPWTRSAAQVAFSSRCHILARDVWAARSTFVSSRVGDACT